MENLGALLLLFIHLPNITSANGLLDCSSDQLECNNRCVSKSLLCNGLDDCGDSSDEIFCLSCTGQSFLCVASARCISSSSVCDGEQDCADGADELLHTCTSFNKTKICAGSEFKCTNGQCVLSSWRCDHSRDCEDGSDEENCDLNECELNNGGCTHMCINLRFGFRCDCPRGMRLVQDTHCEVEDQCLDSDVCDQICVRSSGSVVCDCQEGYELTPGTGQCRAADDVAHVVISTQEGIKWTDLSGSVQTNITDNRVASGPVSSLNANYTLYWSNPEDDLIYRMCLDSRERREEVVLKASLGVLGLAVDWIHECLYWVSISTHGLHTASLNGDKQRQLISGLSRPSAVAVQPLQGYVFWAESGASPRIERTSLDGRSRKALIISSIQYPVAITLDIPRGLLYWADSGLRTISRVTYNGEYRKTVVESNGYLDKPFGLAIFESGVYWTDQLTSSVCSADKHRGNKLNVFQRLGSASPAGLLILHPRLQPADKEQLRSEVKTSLPDSQFAWILFLCVFLSVLLLGLLLFWQRSRICASSSQTLLGIVTLKESQDPLLLSSIPRDQEYKDSSLNISTQ